MIMFANNGPSPYKNIPKDIFSNIKNNNEFVVNISKHYESKDKMNETCMPIESDKSEIDLL